VERESARTGRLVLVAENYCYKPLVRVLREEIARGSVGELRFVQVNALKSQRGDGWRADTSLAGGGALLEGGVHWIDLVAHLGPRVTAAHGVRAGSPEGPERSSLVVLEYEGGGVGTLCHSWETPGLLRGVQLSRIRGTRGSIVFESNGTVVVVWGQRRRFVVPDLRDVTGSRAMLEDFLAALRREREPLMTLRRAWEDVALVEAAYGGGGHGPGARATDRAPRRSAHRDVGDVQGQPA
jgi:predicted dehydrogenase